VLKQSPLDNDGMFAKKERNNNQLNLPLLAFVVERIPTDD
jgi:hypothetical protein